jgi:hypothetical protein
MYRIFFSHSGKDAEWAILIQKELQGMKYSSYLFEDNPQVVGLTIDEEVHAKVKENDLTLVFLSENSQEPHSLRWITKEIGWTESMRKPLVFIVDSRTPHEVIDLLCGKKYINFDAAMGITQKFRVTLKKSLYAALGQKRLEKIITWLIVALGIGVYVLAHPKEQRD